MHCFCRLLTPPVAGKNSSVACAPPHTAFGRSGDLAKRILVLQAHWRMSSDAVAAAPAVQLPQVKLQLGAAPAVALDGRYNSAAASQPALLGSFVGSGVYPPSSLSHSLQVRGCMAQAAWHVILSLHCRCSLAGPTMTPAYPPLHQTCSTKAKRPCSAADSRTLSGLHQ